MTIETMREEAEKMARNLYSQLGIEPIPQVLTPLEITFGALCFAATWQGHNCLESNWTGDDVYLSIAIPVLYKGVPCIFSRYEVDAALIDGEIVETLF